MKIRFTLQFLTLVFFLHMFSRSLQAQDTIYLLNGTKNIAKVVEITQREVKYKNPENTNGPLYVIDKKTVSRIVYQNGIVDTLSIKPVTVPKNKTETVKPKKTTTSTYVSDKNNLVYFSLYDILVGFFSVGYERQIKNGALKLRVPFSVGLGYSGIQDVIMINEGPFNYYNNSGYFDHDKIFSAGLCMNYFPVNKEFIAFGFGPEIEFGAFHYRLDKPLSPNYNDFEITRERGYYNAFMMNAGLYFNISKRISIATTSSLGLSTSYQYVYSAYNNYSGFEKRSTSNTDAAVKAGLQIGYKF